MHQKITYRKKLFLIVILFCNYAFSYQEYNKLNDKSFDQLAKKFYENNKDSTKSSMYAFDYLRKAKDKKDITRIADGYYFLSIISNKATALRYNDSIIIITKDFKTPNYPAYAYLNKANIYYETGNFKKAFDNFIKVKEEAEKTQNTYLFFDSKKSIAILKSRIGENGSALKMLKECEKYYSNHKTTITYDYLTTLFALADSYRRNKKLDSSSLVSKKGFKESIVLRQEQFKPYFTLMEGVNCYAKEKYLAAKDSLSKSIKSFKNNGDKANEAIAHFYLGKTYYLLKEDKNAINELEEVDEIFQEIKEILPETRESYELLISYYKRANDRDNQLKYIERLIEVDSLLYNNYRYLIKNLVKRYDSPLLLLEKQKVIDSLESDKNQFSLIITTLVLVCIFLLSLWLLDRRKKKIYKKRFEDLYNSNTSYKQEQNKKADHISKESIGISSEIIDDILEKLEQFELNKNFLNSKVQTSTLAKEFNTNARYLSKIINTQKRTSFSNYINDLRINYIVKELKENSRLRNYTIDALAKEIGFKTRESFSKAFYKNTGIYPSYFIKELEKIADN